MRRKILAFTFFITALFFAESAAAQQRFVANLSGAQVVPANNSTGRAVCNLLLNSAETQINLTCNYSLSSAITEIHLHGNAAPGQNGGVILPLGSSGLPNGAFNLIAPVTPQQVAALRSNQLYIDFHSANFPNGDVRGQIKSANSPGDVDGDSRADISVYRPDNNFVYTLSSLNNSLIARQLGQSGDNFSLFLGGDFDGDGLADYAAHRVAADGPITWVILQSGDNTVRTVQWGNRSLGDRPVQADYDSDGKTDIAVYRRGIWYIIQSSDNQPRYEYWGSNELIDAPTTGDFDGDGKVDLTVVRGENLNQQAWYTRRSSDGTVEKVYWGNAFGDGVFFNTWIDVDGDGKSDKTVIRGVGSMQPQPVTYYVLRSSDNQTFALQWGFSNEYTRPADYDGDGKTDFAARRVINGQLVWFIYQSSNGQMRTVFWGLPFDE